MNDLHLADARKREPTWDVARHDRVRRSLSERVTRQDRRRRMLVVGRSSLVGAALLALAVRAFASPSNLPSSSSELAGSGGGVVSVEGPRVAYDDGGLRGDVMRD